MPSPSLFNDYGFPHADSILTCLKSSGPPVPGSLGALKVQLLNHNLLWEQSHEIKHGFTLDLSVPTHIISAPSRISWTRRELRLSTVSCLWQWRHCPSPVGIWEARTRPSPSAEGRKIQVHHHPSSPSLQGKFKASRIPAGMQETYFTNMRLTRESQFLQKSWVSMYAAGPPWIPALW